MEKRGRQIFSKIVRASKLTRQRTLKINNAHLDGSRCWQHLQEPTKKTFSFMVSWQKQIKLYFSSRQFLNYSAEENPCWTFFKLVNSFILVWHSDYELSSKTQKPFVILKESGKCYNVLFWFAIDRALWIISTRTRPFFFNTHRLEAEVKFSRNF